MNNQHNADMFLSQLVLRHPIDASITALARRLLLDWPQREQLVANPRQFLTEVLSAGSKQAVEELCLFLLTLAPEELSYALWQLANRSDAPSSWQKLYQMLGPYIKEIKRLMVDIVRSLPAERNYSDIILEVMETWPAAVHKTPSSVIWPLAVAHSVDPHHMDRVFPLAAACAFYYQGVVIFDDIADAELEPVCAQWPRGQVEHLAYSMASALPVMAIQHLEAPGEIRCKVMEDLAEAIWITNIGQYMDLEMHAPIIQTPENAERIAQFKTAKGISKLTQAAADLLNLSQDRVEAWMRCTHAFASGRQVASDVRDIWNKRVSPDLLVGKCTLPVAYALTQLSGSELDQFQELRARCRYQHSQHARLRLWLERLGALKYVQQRLSSYRAEGENYLQKAAVSETARAWIQTWASQADIFGEV